MFRRLNSVSILLVVIVFFAFSLRFYNVSSVPPSLTWDEVSIGYNAWSIWKTGKDEHGRFLPLDTFIGYGDYKPPIAIYLTVPFVAVFGLSEIAVRLPVVIISTLTVFLTFFLVKLLFLKHRYVVRLSLLSALLLAISPWHITISRAGFEAVIALFFVVLGVVLITMSKTQKPLHFVMWIPFVLAMYTFNSARYFLPFFAVVLFWYVYKENFSVTYEAINTFITKHKAKIIPQEVKLFWIRIILGIFIGGILMLPILPHLLSPEARLRFKEVNIFSDPLIVETANQRIQNAGNTWWANIVNNRRVGYAISYMRHYLDHFDPIFLFIKGDGNPKFSIQDVGQMYVVEAIFLAIGIYTVLVFNSYLGIFLLLWMLLAIVPAGVARETPHALRILNTLPTWQIFIAMGIVTSVTLFKNRILKKGYSILLIFTYCGLVLFYLHNYYNHYPYEFSGEWQYGYREAIQITEQRKDAYDYIVVSELIGRPYMYTLFYGAYDPQEFWRTKQSFFDAAGFYKVKGFGKYIFVENDVPELEGKVLYVMPPHQVPESATIIERIRLLNGNEVLTVFE